MIISHRHKFIFVHLGRTGGRSLTLELAKDCGPEDVITPTGDFEGQNVGSWRRHTKASEIRRKIGEDIWNEYFVFSFERNPWDKVLSNYWSRKGYEHGKGGSTETVPWIERVWRKCSGYPWSFENWVRYRWWYSRAMNSRKMRFPSEFKKYTDDDGQVMVNFMGRYEHYAAHLEYLSQRIGIEIKLATHQEGRGTRKDRRNPALVYSDWSANLIAGIFAKELDLLGYEFGKPAPNSVLIDGKPHSLDPPLRRAA